MSSDEVLGKFRDLGQAALDKEGNRLLYNYNSANTQFGTYRSNGDGTYVIHYYDPVDEKRRFCRAFLLLDASGNVARIVWQRYLSEM